MAQEPGAQPRDPDVLGKGVDVAALMARLLPASEDPAAIDDAIAAWAEVDERLMGLPMERRVEAIKLYHDHRMTTQQCKALLFPSLRVKVAVLNSVDTFMRATHSMEAVEYVDRMPETIEWDIGAVFMSLLAGTDIQVRMAVNEALKTMSTYNTFTVKWPIRRGPAVVAALVAETDRDAILRILFSINLRLRAYHDLDICLKPFAEAVLHVLTKQDDGEVTVAACRCLFGNKYNFPALFPDLSFYSTTVEKLESITDADHLKAILERDASNRHAVAAAATGRKPQTLVGGRERIIAILRTFFGTELEPGDTNYETNEYNIDLPIASSRAPSSRISPVKERQYLGLLGSVLAKPQWWIKLKDAATAATWAAEATERGFSKRAVGLLFSELAYLAEHGIRTAELASGDVVTLTPGAVKCTVMSDDALPQPLRDTLVRQVAVLEDVPSHKKDWHPGSSDTVLDLVSTSLYPLTYGRTLVLACIHRAAANSMPPWDILGAAETVADAPTVFDELDDDVYAAPEPSQMLPSEFHIHEDGTVSINSYINNLHPVWHKPLYTTIAKVFERFVPLLESLFGHSSGLVPYITNPGEVYTTRDALRCLLRTMPELPSEDDDEGYQQAKDIIDGYVEGDDDGDDDAGNPGNHQASGFLHPRLPDSFLRSAALPTPVILRDRGLQVIVKLVSIHLSPESPEYHGSSWHTEGSQTEPIVATGICYYAMDNVTTPRLSFQSETPTFEAWLTRYDQTEYDYLEEVYGFHDDASMRVQSVGTMDAVEGRCIAFPNSWQHRQEPFRLADPTRAGHAKMLVFWVVDPVKRVVSTAHVAPQQMDWYATGVVAHGLPADLAMHIGPHIRGAISLESARQTRNEQHDKQQAGQSAEDLSVFGMGGF
ncbi:hypothetical protein BC831DRAFT_553391 [Entophlyctis helioformis]|nr:hypothetical protein BC831DRAFT_553391 [Entophlyctis helioformis]